MSLFNYMWDLSQSGQISELKEKVEDLEKKVEILHEWVQYFKQHIKEQPNDSKP